MNQVRTNQGGSVVSFVIIGVVLVALVAGGVYLLRHQDGTNTPDSTKTSTVSPSASPSVSTNQGSVTTPTPSKSVQPSPHASPTATPSAPAPNDMPKTGPSDLLPGGLIAAILVGSMVAFSQSQRARRNSLNR